MQPLRFFGEKNFIIDRVKSNEDNRDNMKVVVVAKGPVVSDL